MDNQQLDKEGKQLDDNSSQEEFFFDKFEMGLILLSRNKNFHLEFPTGVRKSTIIGVSEIRFVHASDQISVFHLDNGNKRNVKVTMKIGECEDILTPFGFCRVHRKYLVNVSFALLNYDEVKKAILSENGLEIPIARRRRREFEKLRKIISIHKTA